MKSNLEKPSPEAKALSLFLMAHKAVNSSYKNNYSLIKELWSSVLNGDLEIEKYLAEVHAMLNSYGGYDEVIKKTVSYYIDKTGNWKPGGEDQYSKDAQAVADKLLNKK